MIRSLKRAAFAAFLAASLGVVGIMSAFADDSPSSVTVSIPVTVSVSKGGRRSIPSASYKVQIEAVSENAKDHLPEQTELTVTLDQDTQSAEVAFEGLTYTVPGVYEYKISQSAEASSDASYFSFSGLSYQVQVIVKNVDEKDLSKGIAAYVVGEKDGSVWKSPEFTFSNSYTRGTSGSHSGGGGGGGSSHGGSSSSSTTGSTEVVEPTPLTPVEVIAEKLPQTGQLNWPVPFLMAGGALLLIFGLRLTFGKARADA